VRVLHTVQVDPNLLFDIQYAYWYADRDNQYAYYTSMHTSMHNGMHTETTSMHTRITEAQYAYRYAH